MRLLILADLELALNQVLSLYLIPILPTIISGGDMWSNSTPGSTIDPSKQWVVIIDRFVNRVGDCPPPPLCTPYHEPILGVIYHLLSHIIV